MKVKSVFLLLNIISLVLSFSDTTEFLRDFCENRPFQVKVYLCKEKDSRKFGHELYKINNFISVEIFSNSNVSQTPSLYSGEMNYIVDVDCLGGMDLLEMANKRKIFRTPNRWLLLTKQKYTSKKFNHLDFFLDSSVFIAQRVNGNQENVFAIAEMFKIDVKEPIILINIGFWKSNGSFFYSAHPVSLKRKDLNGLVIPAVIVITVNESLNSLYVVRDKHVDTVARYNYILTNHAMDFMNSSAKFMVEDSWGYKINGTYSGMVGKLQAGEAEIAATALFLTDERLYILDYISMTTTTRFRFILRQPKLSSVKNIFLLPFDRAVWVSCYGITFIVAFMLYYSVKYENKFAKFTYKNKVKNNQSNRKHLRLTWNDALFITFGASCQQGFFADARGVAGRLVTIALYIEVILLYTSYSANIVALIQSSGSVIQTVSDLLHSPMQIGVHDAVYNRYLFEQTFQDPMKNELYRKKIVPAGKKSAYYTMEEGVERVRKGLFAFHVEVGSGYKLVQETFATDEKCDLYEIPFVPVSGAWIAIKKHSPYRKLLKIAFRRIQESGLQKREQLRWFTKKPNCEGKQSNFVRVSLYDIRLALFALGAGIGVSVVILALELFIFPKTKKGNGKKVIPKRI